jgi:hypothetical protein
VLCLNGGISSQYTLPWGTAAGVRQEVKACLRYLAHGGGYVIGPSKSILADTPFENTVALVETILNQPTKPLPVTDKLPESVPELEKVYKAFHLQPQPPKRRNKMASSCFQVLVGSSRFGSTTRRVNMPTWRLRMGHLDVPITQHILKK